MIDIEDYEVQTKMYEANPMFTAGEINSWFCLLHPLRTALSYKKEQNVFSNDEALFKFLYLAMLDITAK